MTIFKVPLQFLRLSPDLLLRELNILLLDILILLGRITGLILSQLFGCVGMGLVNVWDGTISM